MVPLAMDVNIYKSGSVSFLCFHSHWLSFQMAALFCSGHRRNVLNDDDRKPQTG